MHAFFNFFASLRLTVVTLTLSLILVFVGTLAQVKYGLYIVQEKYFASLFVHWGPQGSDWKIPVFPGGFLLGGILLLNLIAAHIKRFDFSKKKAGIVIVHAGLIVMFLGQFATTLLQVESHMSIPEGGSRNYSEADRRSELAIVDTSDPNSDKVVAIPERILAQNRGQEIRHPDLPFAIKVHNYMQNSSPSLEGRKLTYSPKSQAIKMNDRDIPSADVEVLAEGKSLGQWNVSNWMVERRLLGLLRDPQGGFGSRFPEAEAGPRTFTHNGKSFLISLRPQRFYKPYHLACLDFSFDRYLGTEMAKNYSSKIRIENPSKNENREVLIYMNNPLRYGGETYYQGSFFEDESGTILQVVRNPSWLTPYVACVMVGAGLLIQFLSHLIAFAKKRTA